MKNKKELLFSVTEKDLEIEYFSGTGAGGQFRNRHQNCVRLKHKESGVLVTGQSNRERKHNRLEAFNNLVNHPKFKLWHNRKIQEILSGKTVEQKVDEMMENKNLFVEGKDENGRWIKIHI